MTSGPRRGRIYWAWMPEGKRRPVLVVSPDERNAAATDVIVIPVSTVLRPGPWHVRLQRGEGGLLRASMAKCEQITTVPRDRIEPASMGPPLGPSKMSEIERAVLRAIGVSVWS